MTCIIGAVQDGKIFMGGDSLVSYDDHTRTLRDKKIFRVGDMMIGFAGGLRGKNVLQYTMKKPSHHPKLDADTYIHTTFVNKLRDTLLEAGFAEVNSNRETAYIELLIGYRGKIYEITGGFAVSEVMGDFYAVGSGTFYALGAMAALKDIVPDPSLRIMTSLEIAGNFSGTVGAPYYVEVLECPIS